MQTTLATMWGKAKGKAKAYDFVELEDGEEAGPSTNRKSKEVGRSEARKSKDLGHPDAKTIKDFFGRVDTKPNKELGRLEAEEAGPSNMDVDDDSAASNRPQPGPPAIESMKPRPVQPKPKPALPPPPPKLFAKPTKPAPPPVKTTGLEALDSLLTETKTTLLAEANEQVKRRSLLFAREWTLLFVFPVLTAIVPQPKSPALLSATLLLWTRTILTCDRRHRYHLALRLCIPFRLHYALFIHLLYSQGLFRRIQVLVIYVPIL